MKHLINLFLSLSLSLGTLAWATSGPAPHASFLCIRGILLSSHTNINGRFDDRYGSSRETIQFDSQEQCLNAVNHSNMGFTCRGKKLISAGRGYLTNATNEQECWTSVAQAKNNFTCLNNTLFNAANGYIAIATNSSECLDAINTSK